MSIDGPTMEWIKAVLAARAKGEPEPPRPTGLGPAAKRHLKSLTEYSVEPPAPPLLDRLDPNEATILYGPGGVGKGTVAVSWASQLAKVGRRVAILDYEDHPLEWARRVHGLAGNLDGIQHLSPNRAYPPAPRGYAGLAGHVEAIRDELDAASIDYVVIDSAVMAAPGEPGSPEAVQAYFAALQQIERPSLTIAHVNRASDERYPFGSVFWHNLARITWSLSQDGEVTKLRNRKANNYPWLGEYTVEATWLNGKLGEVAERPYAAKLAERIAELLRDGPATTPAIAKALEVKQDTIRQAMRRGLTTIPQLWTKDGENWASTIPEA